MAKLPGLHAPDGSDYVTVVGDATQGTTADTAYTDATGAASGSVTALLKGIYVRLASIDSKTPAA